MQHESEHTFHIPVMGTGFTNETGIRLAPYGITSVVSLVNDSLVELQRRKCCLEFGRPYEAIDDGAPDVRARRFRAYLDLVDELVKQRTEEMLALPFADPRGLKRYFELLPPTSPKHLRYLQLTLEGEPIDRAAENELRALHRPGRIDANIMTKVDGDKDKKGRPVPEKHSEALLALRGFAESTVEGAMIFSAGANPRLFAYLAEFDGFYPDADGNPKKKIILKVSDFRSAVVQGKMLARRGLWVSEYRIESGLNCGGHAFPTEGILLGPILAEFRERRGELTALEGAVKGALATAGRVVPSARLELRVTVQGGIGTHAEDRLLIEHFHVDGTGWGSPFLMVPEAVELDRATFDSLEAVTDESVKLSWSSPLGVRFWTLTTGKSEAVRMERIASGHPGSVCTKRHLALNEDYGDVPLCKGSRAYISRRLAELDPNAPHFEMVRERICSPACICDDLGGAPQERAGELGFLEQGHVPPPAAICPGPNIVNFTRQMTLEELVGHIYGRCSVLGDKRRPHMFVREAELYLDVLDEEISQLGTPLETRSSKQLLKFVENLQAGFDFYDQLGGRIREQRTQFRFEFARLRLRLWGQARKLAIDRSEPPTNLETRTTACR